MFCDVCANYKNCPWDYLYRHTDYAEDCIDFKNVNDTKEDNNGGHIESTFSVSDGASKMVSDVPLP